jgi:2-amino-4-hydroxy-6-hydroxymethyldihydropteridine diphosphokinase
MMGSTFVVAAGSNRRGRHGAPRDEIAAALAVLPGVVAIAPIITSAPLGPSIRRFANTVAIVRSDTAPAAFMRTLKAIEQSFGRRGGQRWGTRVIDLDVILWSGGAHEAPGLVIPHPAFRTRDFVLGPLTNVAPAWRDPLTGLSMRQLHARLTSRRPLPSRSGAGAGP